MNFPPSTSNAQPNFAGQICVAIAADTIHELIRNSAEHLREFPFQELRLDYLPDPAAAIDALGGHIKAHPDATFIATCRREDSGGRFAGALQAELSVLLQAARAGSSLVDLSLETAEALGQDAVQQLQSAGARVILSWHDFDGTPDLSGVVDRMSRFSPDIWKIVPTATSIGDNLKVLRLLEASRSAGAPPMLALAMGEKGVPSRILGMRSGSAFTFAALGAGNATAPGQVSASALRDLYRVTKINSQTVVYGVAGDPIRSSLSPLMLNTAFAQSGTNAVYLPLLTHDPHELFSFARELPIQGLSVTMPLKQTIRPLLNSIDPLATRIGAVNTVVRQSDGSFKGFNTDAAGIVAPLEQRLPLRGARVLILGAGGAARAAVFGCLARGAHVSILSRRPEASATLAAEAGVEAIQQNGLATDPAFDVLINGTPAGMRGNATELPLEPEQLRARLVFDLVYNPLETPLLRAAKALGMETIPGVEMFIHQGARQFELWTGEPAPVAAMRNVVLSALNSR